jgi:uncharacterized membrane protein YbhN (UPF0104 family)
MPISGLIERIKAYPPLNKIGQWFTPSRRRWFWRGITAVSLILIFVGMVYALRELPKTQLEVKPLFLGIAVAVYALAYVMQLLGWHALATVTFGRLPLRDNIEAVAASDLVKYLPTVAWYIANRVHFYDQRGVRRGAVIAASLLEMVALLGSGAVIYLAFWLSKINSWLLLLVILLGFAVLFKILAPKLAHWWQTRITSQQTANDHRPQHWAAAFFWYAISWPAGGLILAFTLHTFVPVHLNDYLPLLNMWLLAGLVGTIVSISVGTIGVAREATLTFMLAQHWPLPVSIATAVAIKIILTVGQVVCAALILGWLYLKKRKTNE